MEKKWFVTKQLSCNKCRVRFFAILLNVKVEESQAEYQWAQSHNLRKIKGLGSIRNLEIGRNMGQMQIDGARVESTPKENMWNNKNGSVGFVDLETLVY